MKEKILNALKTKYSNLGLSDKALDGVAEFYSKTVTEESKIDEVVGSLEPVLKSMQSEADRARTDSQSKKSELEAKIAELQGQLEGKSNPKPPASGGGEDDKSLAELTELKNQFQSIQDKISQADKAQADKALKSAAKELMVKSGVNKDMCDDMLGDITISEGDTAETLSTKGVEKFNYFKTKFTPQAGIPQQSQNQGGVSSLDEYFSAKKAEGEEALKLQENAEIK